jgi:hypothetical protein
MGLSNCKVCGSLMLQRKSGMCEDCQRKMDESYRRVRDFLRERPASTLLEVHQETGISLPTLLKIMHVEYVPYGK